MWTWLLTTNVTHGLGWELPLAASLCWPWPLAGSTCPADPSIHCSTRPPGSSQPALYPDSTHNLMMVSTSLYVYILLYTYKKMWFTPILSFAFQQRNWCNSHPRRKVNCGTGECSVQFLQVAVPDQPHFPTHFLSSQEKSMQAELPTNFVGSWYIPLGSPFRLSQRPIVVLRKSNVWSARMEKRYVAQQGNPTECLSMRSFQFLWFYVVTLVE